MIEQEDMNISMMIEEMARMKKIDYVTAATEVAKVLNYDVTWLVPFLDESIIEKIRIDGEDAGLLKVDSKPLFTI